MPEIILNRKRKKRLEHGHPWVYKSEIAEVRGEPDAGAVVDVLNHGGHFLARGFYNPKSQIAVRVLTYQQQEITPEFFLTRVRQAWQYRQRLLPDLGACRAVYGEADLLPGVIVDKFGDVLVLQILSYGMEQRKQWLVDALQTVFQPRGIYERNDVPVRELEGLPQQIGFLTEPFDPLVEIEENGLKLIVDIAGGQKTGYFFDQRENRAAIAPLMTGWGKQHGIELTPVNNNGEPIAAGEEPAVDEQGEPLTLPCDKRGKVVKNPFWDGAEVLECFAHTGAFTLNACKFGAKKVTCLDISETAIEAAKRNVTINRFLHRVEFITANAFDYLRDSVHAGRSWDVVILDPPAFAKSRSALPGALRGYKDINLQGIKLVRDGGFLVTASCSYHLSKEQFLEVIRDAAADAKKILRLVEFRSAGKDHPMLLAAEESNYLKFAIFEVRNR
ncbi:MAG TPA: class I SAM-dependent rRNA methyltransferase [Desulfobacteria bacterium]|nr:class I SAM-dependent rRNA methyltransferase [Desulfobacteria bacterium]